MNYILYDTIKVCGNDNTFTTMEKIEEVVLTNFIGYMKFKSQFYGLNKEIKTAWKKGFTSSEIVKVTIKIDSILSKIDICVYSKRPIPIMHREISRMISRKPD